MSSFWVIKLYITNDNSFNIVDAVYKTHSETIIQCKSYSRINLKAEVGINTTILIIYEFYFTTFFTFTLIYFKTYLLILKLYYLLVNKWSQIIIAINVKCDTICTHSHYKVRIKTSIKNILLFKTNLSQNCNQKFLFFISKICFTKFDTYQLPSKWWVILF